ncbi:hypothetical protein [Acetobacter oeni]|nr:hypothetical protein [Acetobacter oeni]NHO17554.1 hypothetical protein [Acetobacter oeni]GBR00981.1 hypothetical protein AA21952_0277 [Acetobacter oeni LMG 21952]
MDLNNRQPHNPDDVPVSGVATAPEFRFFLRLLMVAAPVCPAALAILVLIPAILQISHVDALFVAQAEAVAIVPLVVLIIFGGQTLPRGVLAAFSAVFAAIILVLPYLAFGGP